MVTTIEPSPENLLPATVQSSEGLFHSGSGLDGNTDEQFVGPSVSVLERSTHLLKTLDLLKEIYSEKVVIDNFRAGKDTGPHKHIYSNPKEIIDYHVANRSAFVNAAIREFTVGAGYKAVEDSIGKAETNRLKAGDWYAFRKKLSGTEGSEDRHKLRDALETQQADQRILSGGANSNKQIAK